MISVYNISKFLLLSSQIEEFEDNNKLNVKRIECDNLIN